MSGYIICQECKEAKNLNDYYRKEYVKKSGEVVYYTKKKCKTCSSKPYNNGLTKKCVYTEGEIDVMKSMISNRIEYKVICEKFNINKRRFRYIRKKYDF